MKQLILILSVLFGSISFAYAQIDVYPEKYGFKLWSGHDVKGKVVLTDFVGTQCGPCIAGLKKFDKEIFERFKGQDLVVIPIVVKYKDEEDVKKFKERFGFKFPIGMDEGKKIASQFFGEGIPRYFVVNRKGKSCITDRTICPGLLRRC